MMAVKFVNGVFTEVGLDAYDESQTFAGGLAALTTITVPNSKDFQDSAAADVFIIVNNALKEVTKDFTVIGAGPSYTQIQFIYDLPNDTHVRFKRVVG